MATTLDNVAVDVDVEAGSASKDPKAQALLEGDAQPSYDGQASAKGGQQAPAKVAEKSSAAATAGKLAVALLCGFVFGWAINKTGVINATVLRDQFDFQNWVMMKVFLTATATSTLIISFMHIFSATRPKTQVTADDYKKAPIGVLPTGVGAFLLGIGMTVSGACPGTMWVQLGSGSLITLVTIGGGIVAGAVHGMVASYLTPFITSNIPPENKRSLDDLVGYKYRVVMGVLVAAVLYGAVAVINALSSSPEKFFPTNFISQGLWNPAFAGVFLGLLQIPLTQVLTKNLGAASACQTLASMFFVKTERFAQLNKMKWGIPRWWQVVFLLGAVSGSAVATVASGNGWYHGEDITPVQAFVGGFIVIFGARIADGCTSGHGISGASHLTLRSYVAICGMFGGAIAAKYALGSAL